MTDDFAEQVERLLSGELPPAPAEPARDAATTIELGHDGAPLDPAQTIRHDRQVLLQIDERQRETMRLKAEEREVIERHWDRWGAMLDRQAEVQSMGGAVQPASGDTHYHVHYHGVMPSCQPVPQQPTPYATDGWYSAPYTPDPEADRRFMAKFWIAVVGCSLLAVSMIWGLASVSRYQGEQDARQKAYHATSAEPNGHQIP